MRGLPDYLESKKLLVISDHGSASFHDRKGQNADQSRTFFDSEIPKAIGAAEASAAGVNIF